MIFYKVGEKLKCQECDFENKDNSKFSKACGTNLENHYYSQNKISKTKINKNILVICITIIICILIITGSFVLLNSSFNESKKSMKESTNEISSNSEVTNDNSAPSRLGSKENPKTVADYPKGNDGNINPYYGDYYYIDGTLFRDDNKYLGGAGTYTYISGKNPYAEDSNSKSGDWYGKCTTHGWIKLNSNKHCPQCIKEGLDPRVLKSSIYQK